MNSKNEFRNVEKNLKMTSAYVEAGQNKKTTVLLLLSAIVNLGAAITSFWLIYLIFRDKGIVGGIVAIFLVATVFRLGPAPLFAVSASVLSFYYHKVSLWLPIVSYVTAVATLVIDIRLRLRER